MPLYLVKDPLTGVSVPEGAVQEGGVLLDRCRDSVVPHGSVLLVPDAALSTAGGWRSDRGAASPDVVVGWDRLPRVGDPHGPIARKPPHRA